MSTFAARTALFWLAFVLATHSRGAAGDPLYSILDRLYNGTELIALGRAPQRVFFDAGRAHFALDGKTYAVSARGTSRRVAGEKRAPETADLVARVGPKFEMAEYLDGALVSRFTVHANASTAWRWVPAGARALFVLDAGRLYVVDRGAVEVFGHVVLAQRVRLGGAARVEDVAYDAASGRVLASTTKALSGGGGSVWLLSPIEGRAQARCLGDEALAERVNSAMERLARAALPQLADVVLVEPVGSDEIVELQAYIDGLKEQISQIGIIYANEISALEHGSYESVEGDRRRRRRDASSICVDKVEYMEKKRNATEAVNRLMNKMDKFALTVEALTELLERRPDELKIDPRNQPEAQKPDPNLIVS